MCVLPQVAHACTLGGFAVSHLSSRGSLVLASDFLASVTVFELQKRTPKPSVQGESMPSL